MSKPLAVRKANPEPVKALVVRSRPNTFAQSIVLHVRKKVKGSDLTTLDQSDALSDVAEWIPSGFSGLDDVLGGGWAVGRASEVFGAEGCGKSAIAHRAIVGVQSLGGYAVLLDFENAFDKQKVAQLGVDMSRVLYSIPEDIEQGWDIVWAVIARLKESPPDVPVLIVWDSIGGAVPRAELNDPAGKAHVGEVARAMSKGCRRMLKRIGEVRAHMMWIAQERVKIGGWSPFGGPPKETSGGSGPKYAASQRLRCARVKTIKNGKRATGYLIKSITKKNRLAAPEQSMEWVIDFRFGPSPELTWLHALLDSGRVKSSKQMLTFKPFGKEAFRWADWPRLLADKGRRKLAKSAYQEVMRAGGPLALKLSIEDGEVDSEE